MSGRGVRLEVDGKLKEILLEDSAGLDLNVLEVRGAPTKRVQQVIKEVKDA